MVQRVAHHLTRTLTRYHRLGSNNTKKRSNSAAIVHHLPSGIISAPCAMMTASRNNKALTGAGIVALGVGTLLCARAYSRARVAGAPKNSTQTSVDVKETAVGAALPREPEAPAKAQAQSPTTSTSGPCEGCDCGMMAPGPLEGTMHAYERHIIICRFVCLIVLCVLGCYWPPIAHSVPFDSNYSSIVQQSISTTGSTTAASRGSTSSYTATD